MALALPGLHSFTVSQFHRKDGGGGGVLVAVREVLARIRGSEQGVEEVPDEGGDGGIAPGCTDAGVAIGFVGDGYGDVLHGSQPAGEWSLPARPLIAIVRRGRVIFCKAERGISIYLRSENPDLGHPDLCL